MGLICPGGYTEPSNFFASTNSQWSETIVDIFPSWRKSLTVVPLSWKGRRHFSLGWFFDFPSYTIWIESIWRSRCLAPKIEAKLFRRVLSDSVWGTSKSHRRVAWGIYDQLLRGRFEGRYRSHKTNVGTSNLVGDDRPCPYVGRKGELKEEKGMGWTYQINNGNTCQALYTRHQKVDTHGDERTSGERPMLQLWQKFWAKLQMQNPTTIFDGKSLARPGNGRGRAQQPWCNERRGL